MNHGSLQNKFYAEGKGADSPEVGMGATKILYTDRTPYTVIEVTSPTEVKIQADAVERNEWPDGNAKSITPAPSGFIETLYLRNGKWVDSAGCTYALGLRSYYYDTSF